MKFNIYHILLLIMYFCLFTLSVFALYLNKDQIAIQSLEVILFFASGGMSSYFYAKKIKRKSKDKC